MFMQQISWFHGRKKTSSPQLTSTTNRTRHQLDSKPLATRQNPGHAQMLSTSVNYDAYLVSKFKLSFQTCKPSFLIPRHSFRICKLLFRIQKFPDIHFESANFYFEFRKFHFIFVNLDIEFAKLHFKLVKVCFEVLNVHFILPIFISNLQMFTLNWQIFVSISETFALNLE